MNRIPKKRWIQFFVCWCLNGFLFILILSGTVKIQCCGICVDPAGNIYVGLDEEIRVFDEHGSLLRKISPHTSNGYAFAIKGNNLILDANGESYVLDLNGKFLSSGQAPQLSPRLNKTETFTINESIYHVTYSFLFYRVMIERDGEKTVAVQMPVADMLVKILLISVNIFFAVTVFCTVVSVNRGSSIESGSKWDGFPC